jgi:putative membrane protein insertion efficiency factor
MAKLLILKFIRLYQKTLSFDHGLLKILRPYGQCKFYPTCSNYTYQAVKRYGIARGSLMSLKRLVKCNPFSMGGIDQVECKNQNQKSKCNLKFKMNKFKLKRFFLN